MNESLPAPEFDRTKYDRPNQDWVCGRTCEGKPCRLGPTPGGNCRSTSECRPVLETRPGQTKGRWKCTRSKEAGGPCETGPDPTGQCGCPIIPCVPQRSLRNLRGRLTLATIAVTIGLLTLLGSGPWRWSFISPGPVSQPHRGDGSGIRTTNQFAAMGCAGCHEAAEGGIGQWLLTAFHAEPGPFQWGKMARLDWDSHTRMDLRCLRCHQEHEKHLPNFPAQHSCSDCHHEHRGDRIASPSDDTCASCHNSDSRINQLASQITRYSLTNSSPNTQPPIAAGLLAFVTPRPASGRTNLFTRFWEGHPDFGVHRAGIEETNTLKFNHQLHLGETVRFYDASNPDRAMSRGLVCSDCHQPDTTGAYMSRIRFDQHCKTCHSLQFDPINGEMRLPHGDPNAVRATVASLATLQVQYAELARSRGETDRSRINDFARTSAERVTKLLGTQGGERLVEMILFTGSPQDRMLPDDKEDSRKRAHYAGCAYCHTVERNAQNQPVVTKPQIPDRWLLGGRFNHAKHPQLSCAGCHASVFQSARTADINLPHQATCVVCHSPGQAPANCATCHSYHMGKPL